MLGQVAVVVLKTIAVHAEVRLEQRVVIFYSCVQKLLGAAVQGRHLKAFVLDIAHGILLLVRRKREDGGHTQRLVRIFLQRLEAFVIRLGRIHAADGKHGVKAFGAWL